MYSGEQQRQGVVSEAGLGACSGGNKGEGLTGDASTSVVVSQRASPCDAPDTGVYLGVSTEGACV